MHIREWYNKVLGKSAIKKRGVIFQEAVPLSRNFVKFRYSRLFKYVFLEKCFQFIADRKQFSLLSLQCWVVHTFCGDDEGCFGKNFEFQLKRIRCNLWTSLSVSRSVGFCPVAGWSVCHNFLKGREISYPCSYRSTCYICRFLFHYMEAKKN